MYGFTNATVTLGDDKYELQIFKIESTFLGYTDHGILSFDLHCSRDVYGWRVGGITLDSPPLEPGQNRIPAANGLALIAEILRVAGVSKWESLPGTTIYIMVNESGSPVGIANPYTKETLVFKKFLSAFKE